MRISMICTINRSVPISPGNVLCRLGRPISIDRPDGVHGGIGPSGPATGQPWRTLPQWVIVVPRQMAWAWSEVKCTERRDLRPPPVPIFRYNLHNPLSPLVAHKQRETQGSSRTGTHGNAVPFLFLYNGNTTGTSFLLFFFCILQLLTVIIILLYCRKSCYMVKTTVG